MKKILGITFGGLQRKALLLVLLVMALTMGMFTAIITYQNSQLLEVVEQTRTDQQGAISSIASQTMHEVVNSTLTESTALQAQLADHEFSEVIRNVQMLQTIAQGLLSNRDSLAPLPVSLPKADMDGESAAYVLCEDGVDYTRSELLGIISHMSTPMIAMHRNSDKVDGCYIGLADGTDLCVDEKAALKLDESGSPIPFPVRQRPWYIGAVEADGLYFTDLVKDAFSGKMMVTCSLPVKVDDKVLGVVGLDLVLEIMDVFLQNTTEGVFSYVINDNGRIVLSSGDGGILRAEMAGQTDLRADPSSPLGAVFSSPEDGSELHTVNLNGTEYYMASASMPSVGWTVLNVVEKAVTEQSELQMLSAYDSINNDATARFNQGVGRTTRLGLLLLLLVVLLSLLLAYLSTKRMVRPIEAITRDIQNSSLQGGSFVMKDAYRTNDEIELLAEAFSDLSKKSKRYVEEITKITAEKERIGTELSLATRIQAAMMPHIFPPFPGRSELDIFASMDPAKEVGGDFYDFFLVDEDHVCLVIADVSGKGVPAALFMMASKIILQSCAMLGQSPAEILTKTNQAICSNNQEEMFVTAWVGILELSTGKLTAANAGHEYPVLMAPGESFALFKDKHGFVIGGMESSRYREYELWLKPGSKLFLYTDGVPEATDEDNTLFGLDRMLSALNTACHSSPRDVLRAVRTAVDGFTRDAEQFDDLTMLCLEYKGPGGKGL